MSANRPHNMYPASWLLAHDNHTLAGGTQPLADTGWNPGPASYGPGTKELLIGIDTPDPGDAKTLTVNIQTLKVLGVNARDTDVLIQAIWGVQGGQQNAIFKVGNGIVFSVPANLLKITAQNLLNKTMVAASAAPYAPRSTGFPGYAFTFGADGSFAITIARFNDLFSPNAAVPVPPAFQNLSPAPFIIPPFAVSVTLSMSLATPGNVYNLVQVAPGGGFIRLDSVTASAGGFAVLKDVDIASETSEFHLTWNAPGNPLGSFTLDFDIGL